VSSGVFGFGVEDEFETCMGGIDQGLSRGWISANWLCCLFWGGAIRCIWLADVERTNSDWQNESYRSQLCAWCLGGADHLVEGAGEGEEADGAAIHMCGKGPGGVGGIRARSGRWSFHFSFETFI